jgi:hypothetical protein
MGEQVDDILGFLHQLAEPDFRSTFGEFIQVGVSCMSWHVVSRFRVYQNVRMNGVMPSAWRRIILRCPPTSLKRSTWCAIGTPLPDAFKRLHDLFAENYAIAAVTESLLRDLNNRLDRYLTNDGWTSAPEKESEPERPS